MYLQFNGKFLIMDNIVYGIITKINLTNIMNIISILFKVSKILR